MKSVNDKLINNNQTGFLKGRFIKEKKKRFISNLMYYTEQYDIPSFFMLVDFEKVLILSHGVLFKNH